MRRLARYGWKKDSLDPRDAHYRLGAPALAPPPSADFNKFYPRVWDQEQSSSCTGQSGAATASHARNVAGLTPQLELSPLFLYYGARVLEGCAGIDGGAEIRDIFKTLATIGAPREDVWPFDPSVSSIVAQPDHQAYVAATWHKSKAYHQIMQTHDALCGVAASGKAFSFGFVCYESFEAQGPKSVEATGVLPMPANSEGIVGSHAVSTATYDDKRKAFLARNSYGISWGLSGYFWIPYDYLLNPDMASDFWTVDMMSA